MTTDWRRRRPAAGLVERNDIFIQLKIPLPEPLRVSLFAKRGMMPPPRVVGGARR